MTLLSKLTRMRFDLKRQAGAALQRPRLRFSPSAPILYSTLLDSVNWHLVCAIEAINEAEGKASMLTALKRSGAM